MTTNEHRNSGTPPPSYVEKEEQLSLRPDDEDEEYQISLDDQPEPTTRNGYTALEPSGRAPPARRRLFMRSRTASPCSKCLSLFLLIGSGAAVIGLLVALIISVCSGGQGLTTTPTTSLTATAHPYEIPVDPIVIDTRKIAALEVDVQGTTDGTLVIVPSEDDQWVLDLNVTAENEQILARSQVLVEELVDEEGDHAIKVVAQAPRWSFSSKPVRILATLRMPYDSDAPLGALLFNAANHNVYVKSSSDESDTSMDGSEFATDYSRTARFGYFHIATVNGNVKSQVPIQGRDVIARTIHGDIELIGRFARNFVITSVNGNVKANESNVVPESQLNLINDFRLNKRDATEKMVEVEMTETDVSKVVEPNGKVDGFVVEERPVIVEMPVSQYEKLKAEQEHEIEEQKEAESLIENILQQAKAAFAANSGVMTQEETEAQAADEKHRQEMLDCEKGKKPMGKENGNSEKRDTFAIEVATTGGNATLVTGIESVPLMDNVYYEITSMRGTADFQEFLASQDSRSPADDNPVPVKILEDGKNVKNGVVKPRSDQVPKVEDLNGKVLVTSVLGDSAWEFLVPTQ